MLDGEHFSGASDAALHFIGDEDDAVFVADFADHGEKFAWWNDEAAFAEHGLRDDRGHLIGGNNALKSVLQVMRAGHLAGGVREAIRAVIAVGVRDAINFRGERAETGLIRIRLAGERHAHQGAAVKGIFKADDCGPLGVGACNLHSVLDRFRPGVDEEGLFCAADGRERVELFRERDVRLVRRDSEAGVQEFVELLADGGFHARSAMASVEAADAAGEIQVAVAVDVFDPGAFGFFGENRRDELRAARDCGFAAREQCFGLGTGDFGAELNGFHVSISFFEFGKS